MAGIDLFDDVVDLGRRRCPEITSGAGGLPKVDFEDARFDLAVMSEVRDYMPREQWPAALDEVARMLAPGNAMFPSGAPGAGYLDEGDVARCLGRTFHIGAVWHRHFRASGKLALPLQRRPPDDRATTPP